MKRVYHFVNMVCVEWSWEGLLAKCKQIHQTYAPDIEIPTSYAPDEVQPNIFRFVTYILRLATQPEACAKYLHVKLSRPVLWTRCVLKLCQSYLNNTTILLYLVVMEVRNVLPRVRALVSRKPNPFWNTIWGIRYTNRPDASFQPSLSKCLPSTNSGPRT